MKNEKRKKLLIGSGAALMVIALIAGGVFWALKGNPADDDVTATPEPAKAKKRISAPQNVIELASRPVVTLKPFTKSGGRFVSIIVSQMRSPAEAAEYEIVYNVIGTNAVSASGAKIPTPAGEEEGGLQAFAGELDLKTLPTSTENRFGTCSAGGACINNSVSDGILTLNFDAAEKYGVNSNWTYFENGTNESRTRDGRFTITAPVLGKAADYLIMEAMGLPEGLPSAVAMIPDGGKDNGTKPIAFSITFTIAPATLTEAEVFFAEALPGQQVAVWDGAAWATFDNGEVMPAGDGYFYVLLEAETFG